VSPGIHSGNLNTLGKSVTVRGIQGAAATIVDGMTLAPVLRIAAGQPVLEGLTFRNGGPAIAGTKRRGSGLYITGGAPAFRDCVVSLNRINVDGAEGAGIYMSACTPSFLRCTVSSNTVSSTLAFGAGVCIRDVPQALFQDCLFEGNSQLSGWALEGGAVFHDNGFGGPDGSGVLFRSCRFRGNSAIGSLGGTGGGLSCRSASPAFEGCLFENNSARSGGAVFAGGLLGSAVPQPRFVSSQFLYNHALASGGAVMAVGGAWERCWFRGNSAGSIANTDGSAFYVQDGAPRISSCLECRGLARRAGHDCSGRHAARRATCHPQLHDRGECRNRDPPQPCLPDRERVELHPLVQRRR
jgi:predicted outer membrane repeat protein